MFVPTHFSLPVIAAEAVNIFSGKKYKKLLFNKIQILIIGICGVLPDLIDPHLLLEARYTSWTHTIWFFLGFIIMTAPFLLKRKSLIVMCWAAVGLHLLCDMVSGGIVLFYPWGKSIGFYFFSPVYWLLLDAATITIGISMYWLAHYKFPRA